MKNLLLLSALTAAGTAAVSCTATPVSGNVEEVSRRTPVTSTPYTGEDTYVPAAVEYSRGREADRYGYPYHRPYGYPY